MYEIYISYNPFDDQYILIYCTADCRPMCEVRMGNVGDAPRKYGQSGNPGNPGNLNLHGALVYFLHFTLEERSDE